MIAIPELAYQQFQAREAYDSVAISKQVCQKCEQMAAAEIERARADEAAKSVPIVSGGQGRDAEGMACMAVVFIACVALASFIGALVALRVMR